MTALTAAASRSRPAGELVIELGADLAEAGDGDQALPVGVVDAAPGRARGVLGDDPLEVAAGPGRLGREAWGGSGSCPGALSAGLLSFRAHGHVLAGMPAGGHPTRLVRPGSRRTLGRDRRGRVKAPRPAPPPAGGHDTEATEAPPPLFRVP